MLSRKAPSKGTPDVKCDSGGGVIPQDVPRAKKVDLITLPRDVPGTTCFTCKFTKGQTGDVRFCTQEEVQQYVNDRNCCKEWDAPGTLRAWKDKE